MRCRFQVNISLYQEAVSQGISPGENIAFNSIILRIKADFHPIIKRGRTW